MSESWGGLIGFLIVDSVVVFELFVNSDSA